MQFYRLTHKRVKEINKKNTIVYTTSKITYSCIDIYIIFDTYTISVKRH